MEKLKVMVVVGTRPEIIRLSEVIKAIDKYFNLILVHTGQNYDYTLNEIFFKEFGLKEPLVLDLSILKLTFALTFRINIASIVGVLISVFVYRKV